MNARTGSGQANKVRTKITDAVKRQSEQLVVSFLEAAASNDRATVESILEAGSIEVDDADGMLPCSLADCSAPFIVPQTRMLETSMHVWASVQRVYTCAARASCTHLCIIMRPLIELQECHHHALAALKAAKWHDAHFALRWPLKVPPLEPWTVCAGAHRTALHVAASNGHLSLVTRLVLKHGASPIARDVYGGTPIDDAIRQGHLPVVEFLATQNMATNMNSDNYIEMCGPLATFACRASCTGCLFTISTACSLPLQDT